MSYTPYAAAVIFSLSAVACSLSEFEVRSATGSPGALSFDDTGSPETVDDPEDTGMEPEFCTGSYDHDITEQGVDWDVDLNAYVMPVEHGADVDIHGCLDNESNNSGIVFMSNGQIVGSVDAYQDLYAGTTGTDDMWVIAVPENEGFTFFFSPNP